MREILTVRSNQKLKQRLSSAVMTELEIVASSPALPNSALLQRKKAGRQISLKMVRAACNIPL